MPGTAIGFIGLGNMGGPMAVRLIEGGLELHVHDRHFGKPALLLRPVAAPPFYAARLRPAVIAVTAAGLRIDARARVLTEADVPIPCLFAAGETAGGVLGERYVGGLNITSGVVFGRIAGREAAETARSRW